MRVTELRGGVRRLLAQRSGRLVPTVANSLARKPLSKPRTKSFRQMAAQAFLPAGYPHTVGRHFGRYCSWLAIQNAVGSVAFVLSTGALLGALGVGGAATPALSAGANWVLKDGLGAAALVGAASRLSSHFDAQSKAAKWRADALFNAGVALELATPFAPALFLPLAITANFAKGIGGLAAGASKAALHRALALKDNLGDVTGKLHAQGTASFAVGTTFGAGLLEFLDGGASTWIAFATCTVLHLFAVKFSERALRSVELGSLNNARLELLLEYWQEHQTLPSRHFVALREPIVFKPKSTFRFIGATEAPMDLLHRLPEEKCIVVRPGELIAHFDCQTEDVVLALGGSEFRSAIKQSSEWSFSEQFIDYAVKLQVEMNEN